MNRSLLLLLTLLCVCPPAGDAAEVTEVDGSFLDRLRREVRTHHPSLVAAQARLRAAGADTRSVRQWEDPVAGAGTMLADAERRRDDGNLLLSVEQTLPRRRLYEARRARARAEEGRMDAELQVAVLALETRVAETTLEIALTDEMLVIEAEQIAWLDQMVSNSVERLKDPSSLSSEPLRLAAELAQERQRIATSSRQRLHRVQQLNLLLGRPLAQSLPPLRLPSSTPAVPDLDSELARLPSVNPMLAVLSRAAGMAEADIAVARREQGPQFSVGIDSSVYSGGDLRQTVLAAKMSIPWLNRSVYRSAVDKARHLEESAREEARALLLELTAQAVAAHTDVETSLRQAATTAREVLPRQVQASQSVLNSWITSKAGLLDVLESRRALVLSRLDERRSLAAAHAALERLRSLIPPEMPGSTPVSP